MAMETHFTALGRHTQKEKKYGLKLVNGKKHIFDYSIWKFMF